ncbi:MAG: DEAD/DEAH box helicase [Chitinophagales bacterium]|nr:DEAD/DEAH box helicase [Chitinophagales bacterium]
MTFSDFNFSAPLNEGLDAMGFTQPTPIQEQVIPLIMQKRDVIACAQTGTGKTAAYILPTLHHISLNKIPHTSVLIIAPTRELAQQIDQAFQGFAYFTHASSIAVYGGSDGEVFEREKKALKHGASVIIATPGRLISHINMGNPKFDQLDCLILDEADKMLDMGFYDDIVRIINSLPAKRQNLLFSATMPSRMRQLAQRILNNPHEINIALSKPAAGILQGAYLVYDSQKTPLLKTLLEGKQLTSVLIFASTKVGVKDLERELKRMRLNAAAIHSDLTQDEREKVLLGFRTRAIQILVATDILSRGIDIENIGLVINYDVPGDAEDYVHRVGRTARAESTGVALTLVNERDQYRLEQIETLIERIVPKIAVPESLGATPAWNPKKQRFGFKGKGGGGKSPAGRQAKSFGKGRR